MNGVIDEPRTIAAGRWALIALAALWIVAHGCHGDDVDHELAVPALPTHDGSRR